MKEQVKEKIYNGQRLSPEEGLSLFNWDIKELGIAADYRRKLIYPSERVGFIIDRIINYTNICTIRCNFCAYHAAAGQIKPYELKMSEILKKIEELKAIGGTQVMLQGGINPAYNLEFYLNMIRTVKEKYPDIYLHSFSPAEVSYLAQKENMALLDVLQQFKNAGLDSMPGASDLLVDPIRQRVSPRKISVAEWCEVQRCLAQLGMESSATMTYGMGESLAERIEHLEVIRQIQDETKTIRAFIPWSFSPQGTKMADIIPADGLDYLKMLAIGRIYLDNVVQIQAGWLTEGLKLAQLALTFGATDFGGVLMEETVVKSTGITISTNQEEMIAMIKNCGKQPVKRDSCYQIIEEF